jgi:hypothetical protein
LSKAVSRVNIDNMNQRQFDQRRLEQVRINYSRRQTPEHDPKDPRYIRIRQAMMICGLSRPLLYQLIKERRFEAFYFKSRRGQSLGMWLIEKGSFMRWLDSQRLAGAPA